MCFAKSQTGRVLIDINGIIFMNAHDTLESMHCQLIHTPCYKLNFHSQRERNLIINKRYEWDITNIVKFIPALALQ